MSLLSHYLDVASANQGIIGTVLTVLFGVSKAVSTEKSVAVVSAIQGVFDGLAKGIMMLGQLFTLLANLLGNLIKSDGVLGNK